MTQKGLIIKIENNHILVLTNEHTYIQLKMKDHVAVGQRIFYSDEDLIISKQNTVRLFTGQRKYLAVASLFFVVLLVGSLWGFSGLLGQSNDKIVATVLNIDINPSVKIELNRKAIVLSVTPMNADAKTLDLTGIIGSKAEDAVEQIVALAQAGGFINAEDLIDDYVLITTIPLNDMADKNADALKARLTEKVVQSEYLQKVNVALIKATKVEMLEAEGQKVPVGLYVIKGSVEIDDKRMTVKEYFSDQGRIDSFKTKGEVVEKNREQKIALAMRFIAKLAESGTRDTTVLKTALENKDTDIDVLLSDIKAKWATTEKQQEQPVGNGKAQKDSDKTEGNNQPKGTVEQGQGAPQEDLDTTADSHKNSEQSNENSNNDSNYE